MRHYKHFESSYILRQLVIGCLVTVSSIGTIYSADKDIAIYTIREMSMGGAVTTITHDDAALMFNPAGLARIKGTTVKAPRLTAAVGTEFVNSFSKLQDLKSVDSDGSEIVNELIGTNGSLRIGLAPLIAVTSKGIGGSLYGGSDINLAINHDGSFDMSGYVDAVAAAGIGRTLQLMGQTFDVGISLKAISRSNLYDKLTGNSAIYLSEADLIARINDETLKDAFSQYSALGIGIDIGALMDVSIASIPGTVGFAVRNIGATLTGDQEVGTGNIIRTRTVSESLPLIANIGLSLKPSVPLIGELLLAADYRINPASNFFNGLRMGVEKKLFFDTVHLRGGISQGYIVGGLGIDLRVLHLDFGYFARELGTVPGQVQDPMMCAELGILF
ncbi:hypothetical protein EB093_03965 [bacterium]|nr:hypothetical protein [bacterium]